MLRKYLSPQEYFSKAKIQYKCTFDLLITKSFLDSVAFQHSPITTVQQQRVALFGTLALRVKRLNVRKHIW